MKDAGFALFVLLATSSAVHSQRESEMAGAGSVACGVYLDDRRNNRPSFEHAQWVWGYISGYNFWGARPTVKLAGLSGPTVLAYLDKFCADHPLSYVSQGADALIGALGGYRLPLAPNR